MRDHRTDALRRALDDVLDGASTEPGLDDPAWNGALAAFVASFRLAHDEAAAHASQALAHARGTDVEGRILVAAVSGLAAAGGATAIGECESVEDMLIDAIAMLPQLDLSRDPAQFARYALAEALLACARVSIAAQVLSEPIAFRGELVDHPYSSVMIVLAARTALFAGRVDEARSILGQVGDVRHPRTAPLVDATRSLIEGNAGSSPSGRESAARPGHSEPVGLDVIELDRIELGVALMCAYGLVAKGDVHRAARLAAGPGWQRAMITDRAIVCELLVNAATRDDDLLAAEAWLEYAEAFAAGPIANSTLARIRSRVLLLARDPVGALGAADEAIALARTEGRAIEEAEGEILAARARIAAGRTGEAARALEQAVASARPVGHDALRRSASRELHAIGRRLRPTSGSGKNELSSRELEVLDLLLHGFANADIASRLHISQHTVRIHVSRILTAFGAASRVALVTQLLPEIGAVEPASGSKSDLTPRQRMVVAEAATGARNAEIARRLGIAVRTVEKHLTDAMRRSGARTRVELLVLESRSLRPG